MNQPFASNLARILDRDLEPGRTVGLVILDNLIGIALSPDHPSCTSAISLILDALRDYDPVLDSLEEMET